MKSSTAVLTFAILIVLLFISSSYLSHTNPPAPEQTQATSFFTQQVNPAGQRDDAEVRKFLAKGLHFDSAVILLGWNQPSLKDLAASGFTVLGTSVNAAYTKSQRIQIAKWLKSVHDAGFKSYIMLVDTDVTTSGQLIGDFARLGVDVIVLDEMISNNGVTQATLLPLIHRGLTVKPDLIFILNEFEWNAIVAAYQWTTLLPRVYVASDNYNLRATIDLNIDLATKYGKLPIVWLIFSQGSQNFDCYVNFNVWAGYVAARGIPTFFYFVDGADTWTINWNLVAAYPG
jgi:hypothetical protein